MSNNQAVPPPNKRDLRLNELQVSQLPPHPNLQNESTSTIDLQTLVSRYQRDSQLMLWTLFPNHFRNKGSPKSSPPCSAPVQLSRCDALQPEIWFKRESHHQDKAEAGTASWEELRRGLYYNHSTNEKSYTPTIYDARCIVSWREELKKLGSTTWGEDITDVVVEIYEMAHQMPGSFKNRVFANLVQRCLIGRDTLVVAQRPVDLSGVDAAFYSNGKHLQEGIDAQQKSKVIVGQYTSIERVTRQENGTIKWEMAVCSDVKGWMPMWMLNKALPGEIAKDCGLVMKWCQDVREKKQKEADIGKVQRGESVSSEQANGSNRGIVI